MHDEELLDRVRELRERRYTPAEISRALGIGRAETARLVRVVGCEREARASGDGDASGAPAEGMRCWVSPGWRNGLSVDGQADWPEGAGAPTQARGSGLAGVLVAARDGRERLSVCGYLIDTWCLGVKNALGPRRMGGRELEEFRRLYFGLWQSAGIPAPLDLAQHLVLGAVGYAQGLGFGPHPDFGRARRALGAWEGPSAITFGKAGRPYYIDGPDDDAPRVLATLERAVGRDGFHFIVSLDAFDELDGAGGGFRHGVSLSDLGAAA